MHRVTKLIPASGMLVLPAWSLFRVTAKLFLWGVAIIGCSLLLSPGSVLAAVPRMLNYQGKLTDASGAPLIGTHTVTIRLYDAAAGGTQLWKEGHTITLTRLDNGIFSVILGASVPFGASVTFNDSLWLTLEVDGGGELAPRQLLTAVSYAVNADMVDGLTADQLVASSGGGTISEVRAGAGLTGGATEDVAILNVGAGTGIIVGADTVSVDVGTSAGKIVQLDATGALPAVSGANLTALNASALSSGTVPDARLSANVSLLGPSIESSEITDGTITAADTAATFLTAGSGVTVTKGAASWTIDAVGAGGTITGVTAGAGLTGGGTSGAVTLDVGAGNGLQVNADDLAVKLPTGAGLAADAAGLSLLRSCADGQLLKWNATNTAWECAADASSGGTVTSVDSGAGLTGGPITGSGTLSVGAGNGIVVGADSIAVNVGTTGTTSTTSANSGLEATSAGVRLLGGCADGQLMKWNAASVAWGCAADANSGGSVTSITAGSGLTGGTITGSGTISLAAPVSLANGGTGATSAATARTALGLGTLATQDASSVAITGGSISGITSLAVADGGTGASSAAGARTNLGAAASGANSDITALTGLTTPLSVTQGGTGASTAAGARTSLGTAAGGANSDITSLAGLTTPLSVTQGGTGASTAAGARANLINCMPIGGTDSGSRSGTFQVAAFGDGATNNRQDRLWPAPVSATVSVLHAYVNHNPGTGTDSWTVTLRKNAADTALSCVITSAEQSCAASGAISVAEGDRLGVEFVEGGTAAATTGAGWSVCFVPD